MTELSTKGLELDQSLRREENTNAMILSSSTDDHGVTTEPNVAGEEEVTSWQSLARSALRESRRCPAYESYFAAVVAC